MCGWNSANYMNQDSVCDSAFSDIPRVSDHGVELWLWGNHPCTLCKTKSLLEGALTVPQDARRENMLMSLFIAYTPA